MCPSRGYTGRGHNNSHSLEQEEGRHSQRTTASSFFNSPMTAAEAPMKIEPPSYHQKASKDRMTAIIREVQSANLGTDWTYSSDDASVLTKKISDEVKNRLRDLNLPRYKFMVQVVLGQKETDKEVNGDKHGGTYVGCRCLWDADTDNYATVTQGNDSYYCVVTAFAIYQY